MDRSRHSVEWLPFDLMARMLEERETPGFVNNGKEFFMLKDDYGSER